MEDIRDSVRSARVEGRLPPLSAAAYVDVGGGRPQIATAAFRTYPPRMIDYPSILDDACAASACRIVVLGALGSVLVVHGPPCLTDAGVVVDATGRRIFDAVVADAVTESSAIRTEFLDGIRRVMICGRSYETEYRSDEARGRGWRSVRVDAVRGGPLIVLVRDLTKRKEAEQARLRAEAFYWLATHTASVGVWDLNIVTGDMYVDPVLKSVLGYRNDEIPNHIDAWARLVAPEDRGLVEERLQDHLEGRSRVYEVVHRMVQRDGSRRWFLARGLLVERRLGKPYRLLGTDTDITERKNTEIALQASEERYGLATRIGRISVWDLSLETGELVADDTLPSIVGVHSVEGWTRATILERIHPDDRPRVIEHEAEYMRPDAPRDAEGGTPMPPIEYRVRHPDGGVRWLSTRGRIVRGDDGRPVRMVGVTLDVTARRRAEAELHASRLKVSRANREIRNLTTQMMLVQEAERRRIARELHDDISQRIAALEILATHARRRVADGEPADALDEIRSRLSDLAQDVRELSHTMAPPEISADDMRERLANYTEELYRFRKLNVQLQVRDLPDTLPNEAALCLYRVAQEALWNVARHAAATSASVLLHGEQNGLRIDIVDDGRGFDPLRPDAPGGFGLASMKQRVEQLRGTFEIEAVPGRGTSIRAWVPLSG